MIKVISGQLVEDEDYYIEKKHSTTPLKVAGIYVRTRTIGHNVGRGDKLFNLLTFRDIIHVNGTPHESYPGGSATFFENDIIVYEKLQPRLEEMDRHNMDRMRENYFRLQGTAGLAGNVSQGDPKRFKKPIKKVEEVRQTLLDLNFDGGPWQHTVWDNKHKRYILPDESHSSSSEKKGGFSRKNKKGKKKRKGISFKNHISKVNV